jgi:hypothetical protein
MITKKAERSGHYDSYSVSVTTSTPGIGSSIVLTIIVSFLALRFVTMRRFASAFLRFFEFGFFAFFATRADNDFRTALLRFRTASVLFGLARRADFAFLRVAMTFVSHVPVTFRLAVYRMSAWIGSTFGELAPLLLLDGEHDLAPHMLGGERLFSFCDIG